MFAAAVETKILSVINMSNLHDFVGTFLTLVNCDWVKVELDVCKLATVLNNIIYVSKCSLYMFLH